MRVSRQPLLVGNSVAVAWRRWWSSAGVASGGVQPLISSLDRHIIHVSDLSSILTNVLTAATTPKDLCNVVRDVLILGLCVFFTFVVTLALSPSVFARIYAVESNSNGLPFAPFLFTLGGQMWSCCIGSYNSGKSPGSPSSLTTPCAEVILTGFSDGLFHLPHRYSRTWMRYVGSCGERRNHDGHPSHLSLIRHTVQPYSIFTEHFFIIIAHPAWPNSRYLLRLC
ncbi:expressed protein [Echinococcus multilocularis]|uniref:Expressed protein n=1 Tax=Echinococcus multilocularis TaxID=6211 RepID=A0A068Y2Q5_ECHMU|nr:expressed protein [Echinococcus multilocularis]